jgi:hypothetical protein
LHGGAFCITESAARNSTAKGEHKMINNPLPNISSEIANDKALQKVLDDLFEVSNAMYVYAFRTKMNRTIQRELNQIQAHILFAKREIAETQ